MQDKTFWAVLEHKFAAQDRIESIEKYLKDEKNHDNLVLWVASIGVVLMVSVGGFLVQQIIARSIPMP